jgi:hypothetical protein
MYGEGRACKRDVRGAWRRKEWWDGGPHLDFEIHQESTVVFIPSGARDAPESLRTGFIVSRLNKLLHRFNWRCCALRVLLVGCATLRDHSHVHRVHQKLAKHFENLRVTRGILCLAHHPKQLLQPAANSDNHLIALVLRCFGQSRQRQRLELGILRVQQHHERLESPSVAYCRTCVVVVKQHTERTHCVSREVGRCGSCFEVRSVGNDGNKQINQGSEATRLQDRCTPSVFGGVVRTEATARSKGEGRRGKTRVRGCVAWCETVCESWLRLEKRVTQQYKRNDLCNVIAILRCKRGNLCNMIGVCTGLTGE